VLRIDASLEADQIDMTRRWVHNGARESQISNIDATVWMTSCAGTQDYLTCVRRSFVGARLTGIKVSDVSWRKFGYIYCLTSHKVHEFRKQRVKRRGNHSRDPAYVVARM